MRKLLSAGTIMLAAICLSMTGCGGGGSSKGASTTVGSTGNTNPSGSPNSSTNTAPSSFRVSGTLTSGGVGVAGATVALSGIGSAVAFTNSSGNYTFAGLKNGNYTVTVAKPDFSCLPRSGNFTLNGADFLALNFTATPSPPTFYVIDDSNQLAVVDLTARTVTVVGNTGTFLNDIAFSPTGELFGISGDMLYKIDPATAAATLVGPLDRTDTTSLEFGPAGTLYTANNALCTVNTVTGAATTLGNTGSIAYASSGDLAFFANRLYLTSGYTAESNALVRLDSLTGAGTLVGAIGFTNVFGLATNDNVTLYGFSGSKVISIDAGTGVGTLVWDIGGMGGLTSINGAAMR